jgi:hypothetical protein
MKLVLELIHASYHAVYDHGDAQYLTQCGENTDFVPLRESGIHGNGHAMMLEKNSLTITGLIAS